MELVIQSLRIEKIRLPEQSLKEHPEKQVNQIAESIRLFGFNDPVAVDENNELIEGVGRVLAAKRLGLKEIPVIPLKHLSEAQKRAYRIAHNKICLNSEFNLEALRQEFEALSRLDETLLGITGFETAEIEDLMAFENLPELGAELTDAVKDAGAVICPHCGGEVYV